MKSITELYKIGKGPSSSHTMGPEKACRIFKKRHPASAYKVVLYGSLSLTGKGHLTDRVIKQVLGNVEIEFRKDFVDEHPNTMDLFALDRGEAAHRMRVYSVGGGSIRIAGEDNRNTPDVYPHETFEEIYDYCRKENISLADYVFRFEESSIQEHLQSVWNAMKSSAVEGLTIDGALPGELGVRRKAKTLMETLYKRENRDFTLSQEVSAYAFAVSEMNASGGTIVTSPTCGACGVMPAVLYAMQKHHGFEDEAILRAIAAGGVIGNVIKNNASISGAEAGCQAEVGSACAMAAAAHATLFGATLNQVEYAAEIALEHHLGLTCDPILGYVQIPCIERNAVGALRAIDASGLALALSEYRKIPFDMVVETMYETGRDMPANYRETRGGGLAKKYRLK